MTTKYPVLLDACTGCCACYNICPTNAISMVEDSEGFLYPVIDMITCIDCKLCDKVCPEIKEDKDDQKEKFKKAYYGWHVDDSIRKLSSSGGVFSAISDSVLTNGGVVYGAAFDTLNRNVFHTSTDNINLSALRKSKYAQSFIGYSFRELKSDLNKNRTSFFVGTPCQIVGLKAYLKKDYPDLLTGDIICHGIPSVKILKNHIEYYEKKFHVKIINIDFRPKTNGWPNVALWFECDNGQVFEIPHHFDAYFSAYFANLILRKSCYNCRHFMQQHVADITIADYWGYKDYDSKINDKKGLSLILVNSEKGELFINSTKHLTYKNMDWKYGSYVFKMHNNEKDLENRILFLKSVLSKGLQKSALQFHLMGKWKSRLMFFIKRKYFNRIILNKFSNIVKKNRLRKLRI